MMFSRRKSNIYPTQNNFIAKKACSWADVKVNVDEKLEKGLLHC